MKIDYNGNYILTPEEMGALVCDIFNLRASVVKEYYKVTDAYHQFEKTMERIKNENRNSLSI